MNTINSNDNKIYKLCKQLASRKYRDKLCKYLIEGPNLIVEALKNNATLDAVIFSNGYGVGASSESGKNSLKFTELQKLEKALMDRGVAVHYMGCSLFDAVSQTETSQGVVGIVSKNQGGEALEISKGRILVLDSLQDPGNVGAIIRTADAAGYKGVMVVKGTVDIYSPKVVRACTGSLFRVPMFFLDSPEEVLNLLRDKKKTIICTDLDTDKYYTDIEWPEEAALVIGNEGNGICHQLLDGADIKIKIPMTGNIESLNAAVAAGILMYESILNR